jgi:ribosomal protein S18 acetylase RimI-like enzyme
MGECWRRDASRNYHPGDFVHWMSNGFRGKGLEHHFYVVEEGGRIRVVIELDADAGSYAPVIDARGRGGAWEFELHRTCIAMLRRRMPDKEDRTVEVNLAAGDKAGGECLKQLGFQARASDHVVMTRSLENVPEVRLPHGFAIRCVAGEREARLVAEVHGGAFGRDWTEADYLKVMRTPGFDPGRELVVVAPDGRFAAFVVIWFDPISRSGLFEPVGCHRDYRRRSLAKALMFAGMTRMKDAGMETAVVGREVGNDASFRLYASTGFETYFETVDYVLEPDA